MNETGRKGKDNSWKNTGLSWDVAKYLCCVGNQAWARSPYLPFSDAWFGRLKQSLPAACTLTSAMFSDGSVHRQFGT